MEDSEWNFSCEGNDDEFCGGYTEMSLYCYADSADPPAPTPAPSPESTTIFDALSQLGCSIDSKQGRIMDTVVSRSTVSAEVRTRRLVDARIGFNPFLSRS